MHADVTTGASVLDQASSRFTDMTFHTAPDGTGVNDQGGAGNHYRDVNVKDPNANYGFLIDSPQGVTIDRSVASNTRYAGVYIQNNARSDGYGATVTRTKADGNTDYGMYAVSKGTKASGNSAESNGVANCFQIDCGEAAKASAPAAPNCGDTITQDVKLKADLELFDVELEQLLRGDSSAPPVSRST